ncbi:MAG TPA: pyridoxal-phosphate dependent enzyme [Thermoanaerobaculia bacterium]|jgi:threonine dehydratase|nr:pyridoxal-phosphate dependent enzyme [Thermoanaerobaculia bacterium]
MPTAAPPVRPVTLDEIYAARERIRGVITRTPLIKLRHGTTAPEIWLKLDNLQPINAFKIRGAANAVAMLTPDERAEGVWTISAGNAGQGVAYTAAEYGIPCTVVTIETAPETKIERMRNLGARIVKVPFDVAWRAMDERAVEGVEGTFIHPFDDHNFIAGNASLGLEILEDLPTVRTVIAAIGGGGLVSGIGSAIRQLAPHVKVLGAEPETAAPGAKSFEAGSAQVFEEFQPSFVDGAGGKSVFPRMWERMQGIVDGSIVVTLDETKRAMRMVAEKVRVIAEGAGALAVAAALTGRVEGPIVAVISGGNIDLKKFADLIGAA